ncbi:MAG: hypothetical protein KKA90_00565 [Nanoarchaeota archaeon]|nr:hypothetical protein [Nanoarchaeota archaeon]
MIQDVLIRVEIEGPVHRTEYVPLGEVYLYGDLKRKCRVPGCWNAFVGGILQPNSRCIGSCIFCVVLTAGKV